MISNELDIDPWRARLRAQGRVQIPGFLQAEAASRLHDCLRDEVRWETAQRTDAELAEGLVHSAAPGSAEDAALLEAATLRARDGFEFYFDRYRMIDARRDGQDPELVLHAVVDFLNSAPFLDFARQLTGDPAIRMVSAIAVRYRHGHFLRSHSDHASEEDRAFAYVLNLSRDWLPDWGGLLQFLDPAERRVVDTFTPLWNSLSLFRVPQPHVVSLVAPWAGSPRYSITGWFRRG
ncbi:2OG-Fe(II) oxygenase [Pseudoxanthomonas daejeonensis]|uniref:2OG-Fe(II) oxygenase n=1 Tax=Pseudoxanthomonas daejeonensis TaxID=266062 RepID=UPI001F5415C7|nr:2OG-Fe(II) oxygenase family protein [Pseudoxanthomonas daejeonensis]UNK58669.1 2OG-Fe(II) oxygenase [Pseudoxanthomonas daejeonensis]